MTGHLPDPGPGRAWVRVAGVPMLTDHPLGKWLPADKLTVDGAAYMPQEPALPRISWGHYEQTPQLLALQEEIRDKGAAYAAEIAAMIELVCWASLEQHGGPGVLVTYLGDTGVRVELSADVEWCTIAYRWEPQP